MPDETSVLQHFGLGSLAETLLVFEPRADTLWQVEADSLGSSLVLDRETPDFPIVIQGERAWVGGVAVDESLTVLAELPEGAMVVWVNESWLLAEQDRDLVVHDTLDLEEVARVSKDDLRSPPLGHASQQTGIGPLRYLEVEPGVLAIVNSFRGTIELRSLPELEPVGSDDVLALGRWEDLEGLR